MLLSAPHYDSIAYNFDCAPHASFVGLQTRAFIFRASTLPAGVSLRQRKRSIAWFTNGNVHYVRLIFFEIPSFLLGLEGIQGFLLGLEAIQGFLLGLEAI